MQTSHSRQRQRRQRGLLRSIRLEHRQLRFESLESRRVLTSNPILTVTVADGTGPGTLYDMIQVANAQAGEDRIVFAPEITSVRPAANLPWISSALTIDGENRVTIDGTNAPQNGLSINGTGVQIVNLTVNNFANGFGIYFLGAINGKVQNSRLGTDQAGLVAQPNDMGVMIHNSSNIIVGTDGDGINDANEGNLISGNTNHGLQISGDNSQFNIVAGNLVGFKTGGTELLSNGSWAAVVIRDGSSFNRIGTNGDGISDVLERNVATGTNTSGFYILNAWDNTISGNYAGVDVTGSFQVGTMQGGTGMSAGATRNTIGVVDDQSPGEALEGNLFAGGMLGVMATDSTSAYNVIKGNRLGTNALGTYSIPLNIGVILESPNNLVGTDGNGKSDVLERNIIASATEWGIRINKAEASGNRVAGNYIGTDVTGTKALGNNYAGVGIFDGASSNIIGTNGDGNQDSMEGNLISGNIGHGIFIGDAQTTQNVVAGNFIGFKAGGTELLSNGSWAAVVINNGASQNRIGTNGDGLSDIAERNVITSLAHAIYIQSASDNVVSGNYAGVDLTGSFQVGNVNNGVGIGGGSKNNIIGVKDDESLGEHNEGNLFSGTMIGVGIFEDNTSGNQVSGNFLGTDATGNFAIPNILGVAINTSGNIVGTDGDGKSDLLERNIISAGTSFGVQLGGIGSKNNRVAGNYIGTDVSGTKAIGNYFAGIGILDAASSNIIGTNGDGSYDHLEGNLISGNIGYGIANYQGNSEKNVIAGNFIGIDATGNTALRNGGWTNIFLETGVTNTRIGTNGDNVSDQLERNVISGSTGNGISSRAKNTTIAGNYIGTNATGTLPVPNNTGIFLFDGEQNSVIGVSGSNPESGNLISGNVDSAITFHSNATKNHRVSGNRIGTTANGLTSLPNRNGVTLYDTSNNIIIGTNGDGFDDAIEGNLISGNIDYAVYIGASSNDNTIAGNLIGVDATGDTALRNGGWTNIFLETGVTNTRIGTNGDNTSDQLERNVISGSTGNGISSRAKNTTIAGNYIGTNAAGTLPIPNFTGIYLFDGEQNSIIGTDGTKANSGNLISGNADWAIIVDGPQTKNHRIAGNRIGTTADGLSALENRYSIGVWNGTSNNFIGTNSDGIGDAIEGNIISGNSEAGVVIRGIGTTNNVVAGNLIGLDATGTKRLNKTNWVNVLLDNGSTNTRIGTNGDGFNDGLERNVISGSNNTGVFITTDNNTVAGNYIGTDASGLNAIPNTNTGIYIGEGAENIIVGVNGDQSPGETNEGNLISGNPNAGIYVNGEATKTNRIAGNRIGTNASGLAAIPNGFGIMLMGKSQETIVGTNGDGFSDALERNLVSGNVNHGVYLAAESFNNRVAGNWIGVDATGTKALGNQWGVRLEHTKNNIIGTNSDSIADSDERNVISGNTLEGISIVDANAIGNHFRGNFIGTDPTGTMAVANLIGVNIANGSNGNFIGTNGDGQFDDIEGNQISGNQFLGVYIGQTGTDNNVIAGNFIGTDRTGSSALGNNGYTSIVIDPGAKGTRIGTNGDGVSDLQERNVISGNKGHGIVINASHNKVSGNLIGTDRSGTVALPNQYDGVHLLHATTETVIGVDGDGSAGEMYERNIISGNLGFGVSVRGQRNRVAGNHIGVDVIGETAIPNQLWTGLVIAEGANLNTIGTNGDGVSDTLERNVISGQNRGVVIIESFNNTIAGNYIGTNASGTLALGNAGEGVLVGTNSQGNVIGTDADGSPGDANEGNLLSGNLNAGVQIAGENTHSNRVAGNKIGTDPTGTVAIPNAWGVVLAYGAHNNVVGVSTSLVESNLISGNSGFGVTIERAGTANNRISGNRIGTTLNGLSSLPNDSGINVFDRASGNVIGTNGDGVHDDLEGNLISGNRYYGVSIANEGTENNVIAGNFIGTDVTGNVSLGGHSGPGVNVATGARGTRVGTDGNGVSDNLERNVISGNEGFGVLIMTSYTKVAGNYIGTNASGTTALANRYDGLHILHESTNNVIGVDGDGSLGEASEGNVISGNRGFGLLLYGHQNTVAGNFIGLDATGEVAIPNQQLGGLVLGEGASLNTIGTDGDGVSDALERNVVSGELRGIDIYGAINNSVAGNYIGTNADGTKAIGNTLEGIAVTANAQDNSIGDVGDDVFESVKSNLIANNMVGLYISTPAANNNRARFNRFYNNANYAFDLAPSGSTPNDFGDVDGVPNAPVITSVQRNSTSLIVEGFARPGTRIDLYKTRNYSNGFGQGETFLTSLVEGSPQDLDAGTGTYDASTVGGTPIGSDETNRFRFVLPLNSLAASISSGEFVTSIAANPSSEFGNLAMVVTPIVITGTSGNDSFTVVQNNANSWTIRRGVTTVYNGSISASTEILIQGGDGTDTLIINGSSAADTFTIGSQSITLNSVVIRHSSIETRTANGVGQSDTFYINSSIQTVNGGDGADRFIMADSELTVSLVEGGIGYDTLDYSDRSTPLTHTVGSNASTNVTRFNAIESIVATSGTDELIGQNLTTYWAITGENSVQITNIDFVGFENLTGGTGSDFFQLWNTNSKITGKILGGEGNDRLTAFNRENTWNLSAARGGSITDQITAFENIEILVGGTQADSFLVGPLAQFSSVDAGAGSDTVDFSTFNAVVNLSMATQSISAVGRITSVERIIGSSRQDAITGANSPNTWEITGASTGSINGLNFESFEILRGGSNADQFNFGPSGSILQIAAGGGADTLRAADKNNSWRITGSARGTLNTTTNFTDVEHLVGGSLDDSVEMTTAGRVTGSLTGGAGTNSLSYRNYTTPVSVNATVGVATNVPNLAPDFQILIGGAGADNLRAFAGVPSVLIGNAGNDVLTGSTGRDILIGGLGSDTLRGGGAEDILIGGSTTHDAAPSQLANLRAEWTSDRSYSERIGNLQGTAITGTPLNNETYLRNTPTDTLLDDNAVDNLYGEDDLDWFIASLANDLLVDRIADELITDPTQS